MSLLLGQYMQDESEPKSSTTTKKPSMVDRTVIDPTHPPGKPLVEIVNESKFKIREIRSLLGELQINQHRLLKQRAIEQAKREAEMNEKIKVYFAKFFGSTKFY